MWQLLVVLVEFWLYVTLCVYTRLYIVSFATLVYVLYYLDDATKNGNRTWEAFRRLPIWKQFRPMEFYHTQGMAYQQRTLFLVVPNYTYAPLVWGFGLSNEFPVHLRVRYMVPQALLWIPIIRDVLMWTGAVSKSNENILGLLQANHSVVVGISDLATDESEYAQLFNFIKAERITLVPVTVTGEEERYYMSNATFLGMPAIYFPRQSTKMNMLIGSSINHTLYDDGAGIRAAFEKVLRSFESTYDTGKTS